MADPKRWSEAGGGATDVERALLRELGDVSPGPRDREAVLAAVLARVGGGGGAGGGGEGGSIRTGSGATASVARKGAGPLFKALAIAFVGGAALWLWLREDRRPTATTTTTMTTTATTTSAAASSALERPSASASIAELAPPLVPVAASTAAAAPSPSVAKTLGAPSAATSASASSTLASRLREESALIARARDAVRSGDYGAALAFLDTARAKFPDGVLVQERRMLEIEALWRSGKRAQASKLADAFLAAYPNSPHAARVRELQKP